MLEKTRDLLYRFHEEQEVPIILCIAGMNPLDFIQTRLFVRITGAIYLARKYDHYL